MHTCVLNRCGCGVVNKRLSHAAVREFSIFVDVDCAMLDSLTCINSKAECNRINKADCLQYDLKDDRAPLHSPTDVIQYNYN